MNQQQNQIPHEKATKKVANGRWSKTQHDRFMKGLQKYGCNWTIVQRFVKTRTLSQVRSHAQKVFLKMEQDDIQAMIKGFDDTYRSNYHNVVTARTEKKTETTKQSKNYNEVLKTKTGKKHEESLLDIFKRAIQLQTLSLNNESHTHLNTQIHQQILKHPTDLANTSQNHGSSISSFENYNRILSLEGSSRIFQNLSSFQQEQKEGHHKIELIQPLDQSENYISFSRPTLTH